MQSELIFPAYQNGSNAAGSKLRGQIWRSFFCFAQSHLGEAIISLYGLFTQYDSLSFPGERFASTKICLRHQFSPRKSSAQVLLVWKFTY